MGRGVKCTLGVWAEVCGQYTVSSAKDCREVECGEKCVIVQWSSYIQTNASNIPHHRGE